MTRATLNRRPLDAQGYAKDNGQYFGVGEPVWAYHCYSPTGEREDWGHFRAPNRAAALKFLRTLERVCYDRP